MKEREEKKRENALPNIQIFHSITIFAWNKSHSILLYAKKKKKIFRKFFGSCCYSFFTCCCRKYTEARKECLCTQKCREKCLNWNKQSLYIGFCSFIWFVLEKSVKKKTHKNVNLILLSLKEEWHTNTVQNEIRYLTKKLKMNWKKNEMMVLGIGVFLSFFRSTEMIPIESQINFQNE